VSRDATAGYYSRPVLKEPVWKAEIPLYFFLGGLAGAAAGLAFAARLGSNHVLARRALAASAVAISACPPLLISDLGRPERFLNMLRILKPTSPMSIGTWVLSAFSASVVGAAGSEFLGLLRPLGRLAEAVAALLGLPLTTYTAVLIADTSIPAWHLSRRELPFVFAGSAAASAGSVTAALTPAAAASAARRLAVLGGVTELLAVGLMERRLGDFARPYREGGVARLATGAKASIAAGTLLMAFAGRRRAGAAAAAVLLAGGSLAERFAVLGAGRESARSTVGEATVQGRPT
jgi:hypothetical protein